MTPGLIHGLGPLSNRISCEGVSPVLAQVQRENGFSLLCRILWTCIPWLGSFFSCLSNPRGFQLGFDGAATPAPFKCLIIHPRHVGTRQVVFSLGCGVNTNTFSAPLKGFQGQHCSFAALFASFEG